MFRRSRRRRRPDARGVHHSRGGTVRIDLRRGRRAPRGSRQPSSYAVAGVALAAGAGIAVATSDGGPLVDHAVAFLRFYAGVVVLVALSLTVLLGLLATDRMILPARHRVWLQSVHRALGVVAVSWLPLHVALEITGGRVGPLAAAAPFLGPVRVDRALWVGLGTVAAYLMLLVLWTGAVRARFAGGRRVWLWRPLHATAYLAWPVAIAHGLRAGRPPAGWVTASYLSLLALALLGVGLRVLAGRHRRPPARVPAPETVWAAPVAHATTGGERVPAGSRRGRRAVARDLADEEYLALLRGEFEPANAQRRPEWSAAAWRDSVERDPAVRDPAVRGPGGRGPADAGGSVPPGARRAARVEAWR